MRKVWKVRYLKLFLIYAQIILEAKNLFILVDRYCPERMESLLRKLYRALPEKPTAEDEFVKVYASLFRLLQVIVDALWFFLPEVMHQLTWKYVYATQKGWEWFFSRLRKYTRESEEVLNARVEAYKKQYNQKVMLQLLQKDFDVRIQQFDVYFHLAVEREIEKAKEQFKEPPPSEGNWLFYVDSTGKVHKNPDWKP